MAAASAKKRGLGKKPALLASWPWTSPPPELCEINFCCLSQPLCSILLQQPEQTKTLFYHKFFALNSLCFKYLGWFLFSWQDPEWFTVSFLETLHGLGYIHLQSLAIWWATWEGHHQIRLTWVCILTPPSSLFSHHSVTVVSLSLSFCNGDKNPTIFSTEEIMLETYLA